MANPEGLPEAVRDWASPVDLLARLRGLRAAYDAGTLPAAQLNHILQYFQFTDESGGVWAPGATTLAWFRWNGSAWEAAEPPARLALPSELRDAPWQAVAPAAPTMQVAAPTCPACGVIAPYSGARFCESCGAAF